MKEVAGLDPGDVILIHASISPNFTQKLIMFLQSLIGEAHGNDDITHAAICTKIQDGKPVIAHITGNKIMGYKQEPIDEVFIRDGGDRAFVVYRPKDQKVANNIASIAGNEKENKSIKWKISVALSAFFRKATLNPKRTFHEKNFSKDSFCSKFVIQAIKIATQHKRDRALSETLNYYPNIRSSSTTKTLDDYLFNDPNYDMYVYPGSNNPYTLIKNEIQAQIDRISKRTDSNSITKCRLLNTKLIEITKILDDADYNNLQKAILLFKSIDSALKIKTTYSLWDSTSYRIVRDKIRKIGIFEKDIVIEQKRRGSNLNIDKNTDKKSDVKRL